MQYIKCRECKYNNAGCRYKMAKAIMLIQEMESFMNLKQPRDSLYKC